MRKNQRISGDDLAVDALMAATCGTGALDPDASAGEAEALGGEVRPLTQQEKAAFAALPGDLIASLRRRVEAAERHEGVGFVRVPREPVYATGADQENHAARSADELRRARKRMRQFLGE